MAVVINEQTVLSNTVDCKTHEQLVELATAIRGIFPSGKMSDGITYWKQNKRDICNKLLRFFKDYDDDYTCKEIIDATEKYVREYQYKGYNGMRCSKYFILKNLPTGEQTSDLANVLEQMREGDNSVESSNWMDELL